MVEVQNQSEINLKERRIYQLMLDKNFITEWEAFVNYLENWIFVIGSQKNGIKWNVWFYCNENWDVIFNLKAISDWPYFKQAQLLSWYIEKKMPNGDYEMYKITTVNWKPYPQWLSLLLGWNINNINLWVWEKVNKYSIDYFKIWQNINFYEAKLFNKTLQLSPTPWENPTILNEEYFRIDIKNWNLRIKDLVKFLEQGQLEWWQDLFKLLLPKVREKLLEQIWDKRFDMVWDPVTAEEIQNYFRCWYINKELYIQSINLLKELGKIDEEMVNRLKKDIQPDLESLRNSIINK